jgi:hypothetical protein
MDGRFWALSTSTFSDQVERGADEFDEVRAVIPQASERTGASRRPLPERLNRTAFVA